MKTLLFAVALLGVGWGPGSLAAELQIADLQCSHGPYGPEKEELKAYPGETLTFRFAAVGLRSTRRHELDAGLSCRLLDAKGKARLSETFPVSGRVLLEVESLPWTFDLKLPDAFTAGVYTLEVTLTDNVASDQVVANLDLEIVTSEFALISPRLFYDALHAVPAPASGVIGQTLHFQVEVIGDDRSQGQSDLEFTLEYLDPSGRPLSHIEPVPCVLTDPGFLKDRSQHAQFTGNVTLFREGVTRVRIAVHDRTTSAHADFEISLEASKAPTKNALARKPARGSRGAK